MGVKIENERSDGYFEFNTYNEYNKLIKSEVHYSNGIIETEQYHDDNKVYPRE